MSLTAHLEPRTQLLCITPELAADLLKRNTLNRPVNKTNLRKITSELVAGNWKLNGETIKVTTEGGILDGQHRLMAVVASGVSIESLVVFNLRADVFDTIDTGAKRSSADTLAVAGFKNSRFLGSVARKVLLHRRGALFGWSHEEPSSAQILEIAKSEPGLVLAIDRVHGCRFMRKYLSDSVAGFCHFVFSEHDPAAAETFTTKLETGEGLLPGDPVLLLRNQLLNQTAKAPLSGPHKAGLMFKAFKAHSRGLRMKLLRVTPDELKDGKVFQLKEKAE